MCGAPGSGRGATGGVCGELGNGEGVLETRVVTRGVIAKSQLVPAAMVRREDIFDGDFLSLFPHLLDRSPSAVLDTFPSDCGVYCKAWLFTVSAVGRGFDT